MTASRAGSGPAWRRVWMLRAAVAALLLYAALATFPRLPAARGGGLDASYAFALNMARGQHLLAGRDIVWTYGPLGWLRMSDPSQPNSAPALTYEFGLWLLWIALLARLTVTAKWGWFGIGPVLAAALTAAVVPERLELVVLAAAMLPLAPGTRRAYVEAALLALLAAFAVMVKFNVGVEAALLLAVILAALVLRDGLRRPALVLGLYLAAVPALFLLSTGQLGTLGPYLRWSWELASGFSASMGFAGSSYRLAAALASVAAVAALPFVFRNAAARWPAFACALIAVFFAFKYAMVRQDDHALRFHPMMVVVVLFLMLGAASRMERAALVCFQVVSLLLALVDPRQALHAADAVTLRAPVNAIAGYLSLGGTLRRIRQADAASRATLLLGPEYHAAIGDASVDAIPVNIAMVRANGWRWRPRPVVQSYSAYTPALDQLNARHLESEGAARFLLLEYGTIDGRHQFFEDPASWRALVDHYSLRLSGARELLLERTAASRLQAPREIGRTTVRWDETIPLPPHTGLLLAAAGIRPSLVGTLRGTLYRSEPVFLDVSFASGALVRWRIVWPNAAEGFIVDTVPRNLDELAAFCRSPGQMTQGRVAAIRFHAAAPDHFRETIPLRWLEMRLR